MPFGPARRSVISATRSRPTRKTTGFRLVREFCGHGIGDIFHDDPQILHYGRPGTGPRLERGMTFTIEPMINAGKRHVKILPDEWTVVTKDHKLSAQWEHTLIVGEHGAEIFTLRDEERGEFGNAYDVKPTVASKAQDGSASTPAQTASV